MSVTETDVNEREFTSMSVSKKNLERCNKLKRKLENHHGKNLRMDHLITNLIFNFLKNENVNLDVIGN